MMRNILLILLFGLAVFFLFSSEAAAANVTSCGVLDQPNTAYVLQNDVTTAGTCFTIRASGITLDLGGHTVTYGTGAGNLVWPDVNNVGVYISPPYLYLQNVTVMNGTIVEGGPGDTSDLTRQYSHAVFGYGPTNVKVHDLFINVTSPDSEAVHMEYGSTFEFYNIMAIIQTRVVQNRHQGYRGISAATASGTNLVHDNTVMGSPQFGIGVSGDSVKIYGNYVQNDATVANPYGIGVSSNAEIYNNTILQANGRGMLLQDVNNTKIYNNHIETQEGCNDEYGCPGWTWALRIRHYNSSSGKNVQIYGNTIIARGGGGFGDAYGVAISNEFGTAEEQVYNNTVTATTSQSGIEAIALFLDEAVDGSGQQRIYDNVFASNTRPLSVGVATRTAGGHSGALLERNTLVKSANPINYNTIVLSSIYSYDRAEWMDSNNNIFTDMKFQGGASYSDALVSNGGGAEGYTVKWTLSLTVQNTSASPISSATVIVKDATNAVVATGTTNAAGQYSPTLTQLIRSDASTTTYTPHTITVSKAGYTTSTFGLTMDDIKQATVTLGGGGGATVNNPPTLNSIGDKSVDEASQLTFSVSASDSDGDTLTYSAGNLPEGATFTSQQFSWTPSQGKIGTYLVTFTVQDSKGGSDSETITITVNRPAVPGQEEPPTNNPTDGNGNNNADNQNNSPTVSKDPVVVFAYKEQSGVYSIRTVDTQGKIRYKFYPFGQKFLGEINFVRVDINGNGLDELVVMPKSKGGPHVKIFNFRGNLLGSFMVFDKSLRQEFFLKVMDVGNNNSQDIIVGIKRGGQFILKQFNTRGKMVSPQRVVTASSFETAISKTYSGAVNETVLDTFLKKMSELYVIDLNKTGEKQIIIGIKKQAGYILLEFNFYGKLLSPQRFSAGTNFLEAVAKAYSIKI